MMDADWMPPTARLGIVATILTVWLVLLLVRRPWRR